MNFIQLNLSHLNKVLSLVQAADPYAWPESIWRSSLKNNWVLAKVLEDELHGLIVVQSNLYESELLYLVVAPQFRRKGIALELLQAGLHYSAAELNAERMLLEVRRSNQAALNLYKGEGFVEDGVRKNYYPVKNVAGKNFEDALLLSHWFV